MARGRHAKPSGLLSRIVPGWTSRRRATAERERMLLRELRYEVERVRSLGALFAADAAAAAARAQQAEEQALAARAEAQALRTEVGALRADVARMREELVWAWAEGRLPATPVAPSVERTPARVIDLREAAG